MFLQTCKIILPLFHLVVIGEDLYKYRPSLLSNPFEFIYKIFEVKWKRDFNLPKKITLDSRLCILSSNLFWLSCCWPLTCFIESEQLRSSCESLEMEVSQRTILPRKSVSDATWWTSKFFTAELVPTDALSLALSWSSSDCEI